MKLYKFKDYEYTTNDLFFDKPCEVMGVVLYPIKAKDYEQFLNYAKYIMFSAKHLGINTKEVDLLTAIILLTSSPNGNLSEEHLATTLIEICNLFSLLTRKEVDYKFTDDGYVFMDNETYEQSEITEDKLVEEVKFLKENMEVQIAFYQGEIIGVTLPEKVEYVVAETTEAVKGNTTNNAQKDATLENGYVVKVPLFINQGETIIVSTLDGKYCSRA